MTDVGQRRKINFRLVKDNDGYPPFDWEGLWAQPETDGRWRLDNIPFFAYNISNRDVVAAHERNGELVFDRVLDRGGHSTLRIIFEDLDTVDGGMACVEQFGLARRQRRATGERDAADIAFRRPHEGLCFRHQAGFVIDPSYAGHGFDRGKCIFPPLLRKRLRGQCDIAAIDGNLRLVEDGVFERRAALGGEIGFERNGVGPGRNGPKSDQEDHARPPFAAPAEQTVHFVNPRRAATGPPTTL